MRKSFFVLLTVVLANVIIMMHSTAYAEKNHFQLWPALRVNGDLGREDFHYLLEAQARLRDIYPTLRQGIFRASIGGDINQKVTLWLGYDLTPVRDSTNTRYQTEQRLWQQLNVFVYQKDKLLLSSRTRFEQRYREGHRGLSHRLRQKATLILSEGISEKISPVISDEVFFNLNNASWTTNKAIDQNRVYLGFLIQMNDRHLVSLGYIHQFKFRNPVNVVNHILSLSLTIEQDFL